MLSIKSSHATLLSAIAALIAASIVPAAASAAKQSFTTTGEHQWIVPIAVNSVQVMLVGGNGGAGSDGTTKQAQGGAPATVKATLAVTPGERLYARVAGNGQWGGDGGYGGGGIGGPAVVLLASAPGGGGGGGASAVRTCAPANCPALVVAGGGGGGGGGGRDITPTINGGNGGASDMAGTAGEQDYSKQDAGGGGGKPGSQNAGGAAGANSFGAAATNGALAVGGNGGNSLAGGGGGGGGGLFGGGGGGAGDGFADFNTNEFYNGAGGGGGGGASGMPPGTAGVSGLSLLPTIAGAEPSVTFTWTPPVPTASTGTPSAVTGTTAVLTGTVNPNLSKVTECHFAIAPGGGSFPCAQQLGAGEGPVSVTASATGLAPATHYTVRLVSANAFGTSEGAPVTFITNGAPGSAAGSGGPAAGSGGPAAGSGGPAAGSGAPLVTGLGLSPSRFRRGGHRARHGRTGTTITFELTAAATVRLSFERVVAGRVAGHRCLRTSSARRHRTACRRYSAVPGTVRLAARPGANRVHFAGVLGGKRLKRGSYRLALVALDATGEPSPAVHASLKIIA